MKEILCVNGGNMLSGEVTVGGAKNSLVALIPASIITRSIVKIENVVPIDDTYTLINILKKLNVGVLYDDRSCLYIDARYVRNAKLDIEEVRKMRASYYFMGALLSLYNNVSVAGPGGCDFGQRPIDLHLHAFLCLGIKYNEVAGVYTFKRKRENIKDITFTKKSVGATINAILACCRIKGSIKINNCSLEPEVDDLINFLNKCGCKISRNGESIVIEGVRNLHGCEYKVMADRIEAGTFMIIASCIGHNVRINNFDINHMRCLINILKDIGVNIVEGKNNVVVSKPDTYKSVDVVVEPYPGFPTDLQQPLSVLLSLCEGQSTIKETIYPARLSHVESLNQMNGAIVVEGDLIKINGERNFIPKQVNGRDLRGGISLVIAALLAKGESKIDGVKYIKRGYSDLVYKLNKLGGRLNVEGIEIDEKEAC